MLTGYEQARSVAAAIAGDWEAARRVELVLPETGVCSLDAGTEGAGSCCGSGAQRPVPATVAIAESTPSATGSGCCG
jgi:hypothetical protein